MKVKAKATLSGAVGDRVKGEEFVVDAKTGAYLIENDLAEAVDESKTEKPVKKPDKD